MRVVWLVEPLFGTSAPEGQSMIEDTGIVGTPTVELFGYALPDVLMWGAPILTVSGILVLGGYLIMDRIIVGNSEIKPLHYILIAAIAYGIFALAFISGGPAARALPSIIVLIAPVIGWVIFEFDRTHHTVGKGMVVIIILCVVTAGVLTPPVAKSQLSEDNFRAWMTTEETSTVEFSMNYMDEVYTSSYFAGYESYLLGIEGSVGDQTVKETLNKDDPESIQNYRMLSQNGTAVIHSPYFRSVYGVEAPNTNCVYTAGATNIYMGSDNLS